MIPKVIYQTWRTQNLHTKIQKMHNRMLLKNPEYKQIIFTDDQMSDFIKSNYDKDIFHYFERINNIVSKADFWRYLVLYQNGGVYLDIDSIIVGKLDDLIKENDDAVITAETNENNFVQWALIFDKKHPILENTIKNLIKNIDNNLYKNNVLHFSVKPYWDAVNDAIAKSDKNFNWHSIENHTNESFKIDGKNFRVYSFDYGKYINFKHKYNHLLRERQKGGYELEHWTSTQHKFNVFD